MKSRVPKGLLDSFDGVFLESTANIADVLRDSATTDDDELAYVIDMATRQGLLGLRTIDSFCAIIPGLVDRPVVLDAAVDSIIRFRQAAGEDRDAIIANLQRERPELGPAIVTAAVFSAALGITIASTKPSGINRTLPEDIGSPAADGVRRYCLQRRIGTGSQGSVYLAVDRSLSDDGHPAYVAVKFLHQNNVSKADSKSLTAEAIRARRVDHPNVARAVDRGVTDDGAPFVVFEYVEGKQLDPTAISHMRLRDKVRLVRDIAAGVQAVHSAGLLHCDLKPSNVIVCLSGEVKVTDFGLARWSDSQRQNQVGHGGTLGFASPEQFTSVSPLGVSADVYALGGLLLYCLTELVPNGATPEEARANLLASSRSGAVNPSAIACIQDPLLRGICQVATDRSPSKRPTSADKFVDLLDRYLENEAIPGIVEPTSSRARRLVRAHGAVIAAGVIACAAVGIGVWKSASSHAAAREATLRSQAAQSELELSEKKDAQLRASIRNSMQTLSAMKNTRSDDVYLREIAVFEALVGSLCVQFDDQGFIPIDSSRRIQIAADRSRQTRNGDGSHSVASVQWTFLQGAWLLISGKSEQALEPLREALASWPSVAPNDQSLLIPIQQAWACAVVLSSKESRGSAEFDEAVKILKATKQEEFKNKNDGLSRVILQVIEKLN